MGSRRFLAVGLVVWSLSCATPIEIPAADGGMSANDSAAMGDSPSSNNMPEEDVGIDKDDAIAARDFAADASTADAAMPDAPLPDAAVDAPHDGPTPDVLTSDVALDVTADVTSDLSADTIGDLSADVVGDAASDCDMGKIAFTQQNPDQYELYQLCIPENDLAAAAAVKSIDNTLSCSGGAGVFANCPTGQIACTAELLLTSTKAIVAKKWQQLCLLSLESSVTKIAGGHYL